MENIKTQSIIDYFVGLNKHVFTLNDVAKLTGKKNAYLSRLLPTNPKIKKIERNRYYIGEADIYEVASNIVEPSYVSLMGAFRYYDLITQMPVKISVVTPLRHKDVLFNEIAIKFKTVKAWRAFGYKKIGNVMMATVEKAFVDALYLREPAYSDIEEAFGKALSEKRVDTRRLKDYAIAMRSGAVINRLGFLLDSFGVASSDLLRYKSRSKVLLFGRGNKRDKKWGIIYD